MSSVRIIISFFWDNLSRLYEIYLKNTIMNIPEITVVKEKLERLREQNLIKAWELPYENLLTRLTAAIFFIDTADGTDISRIEKEWKEYEYFGCRPNIEKKLSSMEYRLTFSREHKEVNKALSAEPSAASIA